MSVLLLGHLGGMGKRYAAILNALGETVLGYDQGDDLDRVQLGSIRGIIIATPTDLHLSHIARFKGTGIPILCEKPFTRDVPLLQAFAAGYKPSDSPLQMVMQYEFLCDKNARGPSVYNYFRHGNDGLYWDCIQIIGLAKSHVEIREESFFWHCVINGQTLNIQAMDWAYYFMLKDWLAAPKHDLPRIVDIHKKVAQYESAH